MSFTGIQDATVRWDREVTSPFSKLTRRVYPRTIRETFAWGEELCIRSPFLLRFDTS